MDWSRVGNVAEIEDVPGVPVPSRAWVKSLHLAAHRAPAPGEAIELGGLHVVVRPFSPGDGPLHDAFVARLGAADLRSRFGRDIGELPPDEFARRTRVDRARETAFVAVAARDGAGPEIIGEVRGHPDPYGARWEFGIVVSSAHHRLGLGRILLEKLVDCARARNANVLYGFVDASNAAMLRLARGLGFVVEHVGGGTAVVSRDFNATADGSRSRERPLARIAVEA